MLRSDNSGKFAPREVNPLPYGGKLWWGETLANLANDHKFAKVSPTNFSHTIASFVINILTTEVKWYATPTFVKCYSLTYKRSFAAMQAKHLAIYSTYATAAGETSNRVICTSVMPCSPIYSYFIANVLYCSSNSPLLALIISLIIYSY